MQKILKRSQFSKILERIERKNFNHAWEGSRFGDITFDFQEEICFFLHELLDNYINADLSSLINRCKTPDQEFYARMPIGEHYKLIQAITKTLGAQREVKVVEIGTYTGMSASVAVDAIDNAKVTTFDLIPWSSFGNTVLKEHDFSQGKLEQILGDLAIHEFWKRHEKYFTEANFIIVDGPKNDKFEKEILPRILNLNFIHKVVILLDDIYFRAMIDVWKDIDQIKFDMSFIGHSSGTGVVLPWKAPFKATNKFAE